MAVVIQRPLRGSRISTFYPVKSLPSLSSLDSAFQLQEYISLLIRLDVHDVEAIVSLPGKPKDKDSEVAETEAKGEEKDSEKSPKSAEIAVDEACWIYEHLRRLAQDLSHPLITMLQQECTRVTCPEMKAGEWLYLCVAHGEGGGATEQCCAIDYILHTLDSATALLNSPRAFPSRLRIPEASRRHFSSLARRLGRLFAHAYFHHREAFEQAEAESSLYARFLALASKFDLVPAEFLAIPSRSGSSGDVQPPRLLGAAPDSQGEHSRTIQLASRPYGDQESSSGVSIERPKGSSPPGLGTDSPRKYGRHRTDTMVFSEAANVAGELAKYENEGIGAFPEPSTSHNRSHSRDVEDYRSVFSAIMTAEDDLPGESSTKYAQETPTPSYHEEATPGPAAPTSLPDADDEPPAPAPESTTTDDAEAAGQAGEAVASTSDVPDAETPAPEEISPPAGDSEAASSSDEPSSAPGDIVPTDEPETEVSTDAEVAGDEATKSSQAQEDDDDDDEGEESDDAAPAPAEVEVEVEAEVEAEAVVKAEAITAAESKGEEEKGADEASTKAEEASTADAGTAGTDDEHLSTDSG